MARKLLLGLTALLVASVPACTYQAEEPGLFRTRGPSASSSTRPVDLPPQPTNPALPVAGEAVWTSADGQHVTVRMAVHAVRRTDGATLLDWSITPLAAPGASSGQRLASSVNLGLSRSGSDVAIVLLDPTGTRVYRPLTHSSARLFHHCLCTPVWLAQQRLRIGETQLMQAAFPPLPDGLASVDVGFATVAPVVGVPVTPTGQVPTARQPVDLARPAPAAEPVSHELRFGPQQGLGLRVDRIVAGPGATAVEWTLHSVLAQQRTRVGDYGPPVTSPTAHSDGVYLVNESPTDGLTVRPTQTGSSELPASWMTGQRNGRVALECLCTELGLWASDRWTADGHVQVVALYPPLPAGTAQVDVALPGVGVLRGLSVQRPPAASTQVGPPVDAPPGSSWTYANDKPPPPWTTTDWPTPGPELEQQGDYDVAVETVRPLPPPGR